MKTTLRLMPQASGEQIVEVWYGSELVGQITAVGIGPGVRLISTYAMQPDLMPNPKVTPVHVIEVRIGEQL